jgi:hypothetical protein
LTDLFYFEIYASLNQDQASRSRRQECMYSCKEAVNIYYLIITESSLSCLEAIM